MSGQLFVVGSSHEDRQNLSNILEPRGFTLAMFGRAEDFFSQMSQDVSGCVLAELEQPGWSHVDFHSQLKERFPLLTVVFISSSANVATAVKVMSAGAVALLEKPLIEDAVLAAVERGVAQSARLAAESMDKGQIQSRLETLTPEENQVLHYMVQGTPNKKTAMELNLSPRTLDRRRATILEKMHAHSVPELAAMMARVNPRT